MIVVGRNYSFQGKTAVVTGASSGIGESTVKALAAQGTNVILLARSEDKLNAMCSALSEQYKDQRFYAVRCDMACKESVDAAAKTCAELCQSRVDILVNNAGMGMRDDNAWKADPDQWDTVMQVNLLSLMRLTQRILTSCMQHSDKDGHEGCSIINICSIAGKMGMAGSESYSASKHGVHGFSQSLFEDVRAQGIKVVSICPGFVSTGMTAQAGERVDHSKMIQSEDVAELIMYCISSPKNMCPVDITIRPQYSPYK